MTRMQFKRLELLAFEKGIASDQGSSLETLAKLVVGKTLLKPQHIRCGQWSNAYLPPAMKAYAALDAKISLDVLLDTYFRYILDWIILVLMLIFMGAFLLEFYWIHGTSLTV